MTEPIWLELDVVEAFHDEQIAEHGGSLGLRDRGLFESALAAPRHRYSYGERDLFVLAAAYGHSIARNHPFIDGNKRTAFVAALAFLRVNSVIVKADQADIVVTMNNLAAGLLSLDEFVEWLRSNAHRE